MNNEKLAKWAGFRQNPYPYKGEREHWFTPDKNTTDRLPNFLIDETACFKWLVPKLTGWQMRNWNGLSQTTVVVWQGNAWDNYCATKETPALALCLAISKLIDGGKNG